MKIIRYLILALCVLSTAITMLTRLNLNITIVAMAREVIASENETIVHYCKIPEDDVEKDSNSTERAKTNDNLIQYDWDGSDQVRNG